MAEARAFARAHGLAEDRVWRSWQKGPSKLFLNDLEQRFNARMIAHLRGIGVKVPIVTTNLWGSQMSSLPALAAGDMIDVHAYEDTGFLERDPRLGGNVVHTIAAAQLAGMPVSVSEWNMGKFPTRDRQELPLYMAATATHQGLDALMHYAYAQKPLQLPAAASNWHAFNDPSWLAMLPAAALLYRQRHVREAASVYAWSPSATQLFDGSTPGSDWVALRVAVERGRLVTVLPPVPELPWLRLTSAPTAATAIDTIARDTLDVKANEVVSDTGELRRNWKTGVFIIDTPRTQAAVGSVGGRSIVMSDVAIRMDTPRVSVAVQTLDNSPIGRSNDILVSIASSSVPSSMSTLPFLSESTVGDIEIRAKSGLAASGQSGVQVHVEGNKYVVHLDGKSAVHWVNLRRPSKGG
jgi:hypothetical protein